MELNKGVFYYLLIQLFIHKRKNVLFTTTKFDFGLPLQNVHFKSAGHKIFEGAQILLCDITYSHN